MTAVDDAGRTSTPWSWPERPLHGRRGVVVGAATGIGRAVALATGALADEVLLVDRDESVADVAAQFGGQALQLDVTDPATPAALSSLVERQWGAADFLVCCAGIQRRGPALELPEQDWADLFDTNFHGIRRLTTALVRGMTQRGRGAVVNVSSSSVESVTPGIVPYSTAKAALAQWTRGLAAEVGHHGVRVNAVAPGYIATAMTAGRLADETFRERVRTRIKLGDIGHPEDVVGPIVYLLSDAAGYLTGVVLPVDGGYFLGA